MKRKAAHKYRAGLIRRARDLRQSGSPVEKIFWRALRSHPDQEKFRFRYQHPIFQYVVDFISLSAKLVVEVDGSSHDATFAQDVVRQKHLEDLGYQVLRVSNSDVLGDVSSVAAWVYEQAKLRLVELQK
ncbi:MAG: DUF559 domain-containing protein [Alphaproteobacteria bacterium]|jgi:very-short-patch-repair endonuclease|nr:DUF559 domain-containing protein [Alphaproteobacteria bacterium]